ncbi:hypothetical protein OW763_15825 [Clostridium aestuarii]|uniref:Uncharacterized protein n=1 Tax=Clostridium aestuarii TaxID=338193 RepID=A0ABT4D3H5_9CLOT|nr:hypothetical protein [Clostridium aestuarii]MCY6485789.1 hypothetical protein [Clostridium aestuarii]
MPRYTYKGQMHKKGKKHDGHKPQDDHKENKKTPPRYTNFEGEPIE